MEIKMVSCPKCGDLYNSAQHAVCPHCGASARPSNATRGGKTTAVNGNSIETERGNGAGICKTEPAYGGSGVTIPVTPNTNGSGSFGPTEIGDDIAGEFTTEPVVGWLVCIDGMAKGMDFRIHAGYNYIGRETGDIRIGGDMQISHENHAMIIYDPMDHSYYFGPSRGRNIVRVNSKPVLSSIEIHSYDIITIGKCQLIFVALCGNRFSWEKGVTSDNG